MAMALGCMVFPRPATSPTASSSPSPSFCPFASPFPCLFHPSLVPRRFLAAACTDTTSHLRHVVDKSLIKVSEAFAEEELWAAACLRVRSFNLFNPSTFSPSDRMKYLAEREFEALKERIAGKQEGFGRVSCINAALPLSEVQRLSDDLCASCKFSDGEEERVVIGSLDLNRCMRLPDEIPGTKPEGIGADFARAYLSNVCVAKELHRHGLGYMIVNRAKAVAQEWGITDLYVHVAVDNTPAKNLYMKSGFVHESDEPAWQARFLDRPRRILLWMGLPATYEL
ncbi:hypothetical protein MLD38_019955 [Melastoma candidum]|uniref:Uncharacterized protein n=1 Tax=Melastoma candidum TaxID=119954 RepID=A0ACB9QCE1_9MYRT|nr:hypothetical protein MLD38_019955 [Melastoma candidum]